MQITSKDIERILLLLFSIGVGLRFSGGTLPFIKPIILIVTVVLLYFFYKVSSVNSLKNERPNYSISLILFLLYLLFSVTYTYSINYGLSKVLILTLWLVSFTTLSKLIIDNFYHFLLFTFVSLVIVLLLFYNSFGSPLEIMKNVYSFYRLQDEETNPNSYSRFLGFGVLASLFLLSYQKDKKYMVILIIPFIALALSYMFFSGSKGPLLALIFCLFFNYVILNNFSVKKLLIVSVIVFFTISLPSLISSSNLNDFFIQRFINYEGSLEGRNERYLFVINKFNENSVNDLTRLLLGNGSGNFSFAFDGADIRSYPHNIFLEVIYEYGIIGLVFLLNVVISPFVKCVVYSISFKNKILKILLVFWVYTLITSMVSSDLAGNFLLFGFSILLGYVYRLKT